MGSIARRSSCSWTIRQARKTLRRERLHPLGDRLDVDAEGRGHGLRRLFRLNPPHDFGSTVLRQPDILMHVRLILS